MTQKSLFSFFKPTAPTTKVPESQPQTDSASLGLESTSASSKMPTVRNGQGNGYSNGVNGNAFSGHRPSALFSTDEAVMPPSTPPSKTATKRKTMDFDEKEVPSPMKAQHETPNVKRFAAEVEKLSLNTPMKQPRLDIPDEDDLEESLGSRRSVKNAATFCETFSARGTSKKS